jgi:hypothetical protein
MVAKKTARAPAQASVTVDEETHHNLAALEAEHEAAQTALENDEEWTGRDPAVIEAEMHEAQLAARAASQLNTGANGNVTRKEFEDLKFAVAVAFIGIEATLREPNVSPRRVLNIVMENFAAMGFSRAQSKELADFERRADVVGKHYGDWDRRTKSQRERAAREDEMRRPRWMA